MLKRLARTCYRRRWRVLAAWVVFLVAVSVFSSAAGGVFRNEFSLSGSESKQAQELLKERGFGDRAGFSGQIVFATDRGVDDPIVQQKMERLFARIERTVPRTQIVSPYTTEGAGQVSDNRRIAYGEVNFADRSDKAFQDAADKVKAQAEAVKVSGVRIELGGQLFRHQDLPASEAIGVFAAIIVLLIAFGSVLAAGLPILTALFGIGTGIALVQLTANGLTMPDFTTQAVAMIGIGVGIDYALLIITCYRQALRDGHNPEGAVALAADTAGRSVVFAGTTVVWHRMSTRTTAATAFITKSITQIGYAMRCKCVGRVPRRRYLNHSTSDKAPKGSGALYCVVESVSALAIWSRV